MPERFHSNWLQMFVFCLINHFFLDISIKKHKNINFSNETDIIVSLFFLDAKISQENKTPVTSIFSGDTFSGVQTNLISFIPLEYKSSLVHTLTNRFFDLLSIVNTWNLLSWELFSRLVIHLKCVPETLLSSFVYIFSCRSSPKLVRPKAISK